MRKRALFFIIAVITIWAALTVVALAQSNAAQSGGNPDVAVVLAPLVAAALGIERLLETLWGVVEMVLDVLGITPTDEKYIAFKTWASAAMGILLGIILASAARLQMFGLLGLHVNAGADVFITGLVIGSGSKFTHDVIGILSEGKRGLEQWRKLTESRRTGRVVE